MHHVHVDTLERAVEPIYEIGRDRPVGAITRSVDVICYVKEKLTYNDIHSGVPTLEIKYGDYTKEYYKGYVVNFDVKYSLDKLDLETRLHIHF